MNTSANGRTQLMKLRSKWPASKHRFRNIELSKKHLLKKRQPAHYIYVYVYIYIYICLPYMYIYVYIYVYICCIYMFITLNGERASGYKMHVECH